MSVAETRSTVERLGELFVAAPAVIAVLRGPELAVDLLNAAARPLFGDRDVVGRPLREAVPELDAQGVVTLFQRVFDTGEPFSATELPVHLARGDGALRESWFSGIAMPMRDAAGRVEGVMIFAHDVTEHVQARLREQAAREHAERVLSQLTAVHEVTASLARALTDEEAAEIVVDEGMHALGADTGMVYRLVGDRLDLLRHRGIAAGLVEGLRRVPIDADNAAARAARTLEPLWVETQAEYVAVAPDVARRVVAGPRAQSFACVPLTIDGRVLGIMAFGFHAEHRFAEEERAVIVMLARQCAQALERADLYAREQHTAAQLRLLADASVLLSSTLDYETTLGNLAALVVPHHADWCAIDLVEEGEELPRLVAIAHVDPSKVALGWELRRAMPPRASDPQGLMNVLRTGESELYPEVSDALLEATAKDARELEVARSLQMRSVMIVPLKHHLKTIGAITLVSTDERRRYTADDVRLWEDLASRASLAVANARLHREARDAVRMRDDFLSIASHELNTPLTSLRLVIESLRRGRVAPEKVPAKLESADKQVTRLTNLVRDLLDVSRIVSGRLKLAPEDVDLLPLVRDTIARFGDALSRSGSTIELHAPEQPIVGSWDPVRIEQAIANLLSNAIKYGEGKPIEVELASDGARARITVRDRGIGIAPEDQARIFRRFERAVSGRHYGGFGLGLWIAREAIEASGGSIHVESRRPGGSTFTIDLPLRASVPPR